MRQYHDIYQYLGNINVEGDIIIDTNLYKFNIHTVTSIRECIIINENTSVSDAT